MKGALERVVRRLREVSGSGWCIRTCYTGAGLESNRVGSTSRAPRQPDIIGPVQALLSAASVLICPPPSFASRSLRRTRCIVPTSQEIHERDTEHHEQSGSTIPFTIRGIFSASIQGRGRMAASFLHCAYCASSTFHDEKPIRQKFRVNSRRFTIL